MAELLSPAAIDALVADAEASGMGLDGAQGLLNQLTKAVLERALETEMADHLGYDKGDPAGYGSGNSRNGKSAKTVVTNSGPVRLDVPRDRASTFEPRIVPKRKRRLGQIDDMILSLYARGMTTRDIKEHLAEVYDAEVSPALISNVTDVVAEEITQWQNRPVDAVYPIMYIDAVVVKIREGGTVDNRSAHLVVGVDTDGFKHVLGIWIGENEGAKFWQNVLNELVNRGLNDVLIVCCDGLTGLPDAIGNVWPKAIVQTCVVHLIRASMRFVSLDDRKAVAKSLKPIYEAANEAAAQQALNELKHTWGQKYTGLISTWERAWEEFIPFLEFHPAIRKVIYTTNMIESINYQLRKISKTRGHFPSVDAAIKLLYLGVRNITGRHIDGEGQFAGKRGTGTYGWKRALNAFATRFGDRLPL
ncbi:IS256 family transposase [Amycolatopsis sp. CA-230715]|uniref:IS256 family transposase n=1 Tax=Amycolatopsis sp. CA-230715 TaxID=2745196 RepID=UPI001C021239|nr:IS256 family transposase [Amycolatopsis sp. CA-230715]